MADLYRGLKRIRQQGASKLGVFLDKASASCRLVYWTDLV